MTSDPNQAAAAIIKELERIRHLGDSPPAIVIEVAYVDRRDNNDNARESHVASAALLCRQLNRSARLGDSQVFVVSFVNDLSDNPVCGIGACSPDDLHKTSILWRRARTALDDINEEVSGREIFSMRRTKSRGIRLLKAAMKDERRRESKALSIDHGLGGRELLADIVLNAGGERIMLASLDTSSRRVSAKCALLMAQHYIDLRKFVLSHNRFVRRMCLIDFNVYTERDRVRQGAIASVSLASPVSDLEVWVINCVYFPDHSRSVRLQVTSMDDAELF